MQPLRTNFTNPTDVLSFLSKHSEQGCALIIVTDTEGGGVRAPGALVAVSNTGECAGYISNGCVDADMFAQAREAIKNGTPRNVRYGAGSPYLDIRLPCGGAIDLLIIPNPDQSLISQSLAALHARQSISLAASITHGLQSADNKKPAGWNGDVFFLTCRPKLRLRIAGRGTEPIALMRAAKALDFDVVLQSPDAEALELAGALGFPSDRLETPSKIGPIQDDADTAFVMMFHDHDWEADLLMQALTGEAFYIGALGGRTTHQARCAHLISLDKFGQLGLTTQDLDRIHGPIGLVSPVREASFLAISVLAEIIEIYQNQ